MRVIVLRHETDPARDLRVRKGRKFIIEGPNCTKSRLRRKGASTNTKSRFTALRKMRITTTAAMQKSSRNLAVRAASGAASTTLGGKKRTRACTTFSGASKFIVRTINQKSPCSHGRIGRNVRHDHVQPELRNGSWDGGRRIFIKFAIKSTTPDTRPSGRLKQARD